MRIPFTPHSHGHYSTVQDPQHLWNYSYIVRSMAAAAAVVVATFSHMLLVHVSHQQMVTAGIDGILFVNYIKRYIN